MKSITPPVGQQAPQFAANVVGCRDVEVKTRDVEAAYVVLADETRGSAGADEGTHVFVQALAGEADNHRRRRVCNPAASQRAREIEQPEFVAYLHEVGALLGENAAEGTAPRPRVKVRQHPAVARIDDRDLRRRDVVDA